MRWTLTEYPDPDALAAGVAAQVAAALDDALAQRGASVMALAGGRTAPPVFKRLAEQRRDWSRVLLLPSDERWVADGHVDNNLRQMRAGFAAAATEIRWLSLLPPDPKGSADATSAQHALADIPGEFDLVLLGMGADGHFASLFPGAPNLADALALDCGHDALAVVPDPLPAAGPFPRISLTLARLLRSRRVLLAITGADKRAVLEQAQAGADPLQLPVAALLANPIVHVEIHWSP